MAQPAICMAQLAMWWQTKFNVSPGLWSLVLGTSGPDLGPDLDLDLSLTKIEIHFSVYHKLSPS